jgi:hypothetical protein
MTFGVNIPTITVQSIVNNVSVLGSNIMSNFGMNAAPQEHTSNKAWNDPINGDADEMFWVNYQNIHGISCDDVVLAQDLQVLAEEYDIGCICLSEMNLDWHRPYVQSDYLARQHKTWKHVATSFSSIDMESSLDYITGGTLTPTVDQCSSQVFAKDADLSGMGQWSYQMLVGKRNSKITIIARYQCVKIPSANSSAWTQEKIYMRDRQSKSSPNPRKQFVKDLIKFINAKRLMNHDIILNLDATKVLGKESQGIAKIMQECDLVDLLDMPECDPKCQLKDTYR